MKKGLIILVFLTLSFAGYAQQDLETTNGTDLIETIKADKSEAAKKVSAAKIKTQVLKINHKKSNEIISIKAYRKSLQIKVKTVKLC
jgi:hypothetical protein